MFYKFIPTLLCLTLILNNISFSKDRVDIKTLSKTTKSWNGNPLPKYPKGQPQITILKIKIPPHHKLPVHLHPIINAGVMLDGELTVITNKNQKLYLKKGDAIVEVVNTWHYGINNTNRPATIIVFYAGIKGKQTTILKKE